MTFAEAAAYRMPFGKFLGQRLEDAARDDRSLLYLDWMVGQGWVPDRTREALAAYLSEPAVATRVARLFNAGR